jgi:hypothetical protein
MRLRLQPTARLREFYHEPTSVVDAAQEYRLAHLSKIFIGGTSRSFACVIDFRGNFLVIIDSAPARPTMSDKAVD